MIVFFWIVSRGRAPYLAGTTPDSLHGVMPFGKSDSYRSVMTTTPGLRDVLRGQRPLCLMIAAMTALAVTSATGMVVDDRELLGVSVWLKPLKFAVAFALYGSSLAWLLTFPHRGSRWTSILAAAFAVAGVVDVGFIAVQAARGTYSHFNTSSDAVNRIGQLVFMSGVPGLFVANLLIAVILLRQKIADRPTSRAIHSGLGLAVVGMALGYTMGFQGAQIVRDAHGRIVDLAARHTVGATDDHRGMPITDWSTTGGDLRIPHFVGLHAIQVLIVVAVLLPVLGRRIPWLRDEDARSALVGVIASAYAGLLTLVAWQAYRGQPLARPDAWTALVAALLLAATAVAVFVVRTLALRRSAAEPDHLSRSASLARSTSSVHS